MRFGCDATARASYVLFEPKAALGVQLPASLFIEASAGTNLATSMTDYELGLTAGFAFAI